MRGARILVVECDHNGKSYRSVERILAPRSIRLNMGQVGGEGTKESHLQVVCGSTWATRLELYMSRKKAAALRHPGRKLFWWDHRAYILIEVGVEHPEHNYFIEIAKGRNPRFLHLGTEWDHPERLTENATLDVNGFYFMKKCRVLSELVYSTSSDW